MDPPETKEILAEVAIRRGQMLEKMSEISIKSSLCEAIAKELLVQDLVEIKYTDSPLYDHVIIYGRVKVIDHKFKLKILI